MVHDPRVATLLARLGGLYRDPSRVDRDVSTVLKSSVGEHLAPNIGHLIEMTQPPINCNCLVLQGTIGIVFRGMTYQLLIDLFIPPGYPYRPPIVYLRLAAPNMYFKENHKHVGNDGKVYLPYLHEWKVHSHNLIELIVAMSSIFSADPPIFTRTTPAATTSTNTNTQSNNTSPMRPPNSGNNNSSNNSNTQVNQQQELQDIIAQEVEEANRIAEIARLAEQNEMEEQKIAKAQEEWELKKKKEVQDDVTEKLNKYFIDLIKQAGAQVREDIRDQQHLEIAHDEKITKQISSLTTMKQKLQEQINVVNENTVKIQEWLEDSNNNNAAMNGTNDSKTNNDKENDIDKMIQPKSKLHDQMLQLSAENASLSDVLYFIDHALMHGQMDCETHIKQVRRIAKRQFLVRAHLLKIRQSKKFYSN